MAGKLKPAGAPPKKPKAKKVKAPKPGKPALAVDNTRKGKNTVSRAEAIAEFEELFELHRELGEVSGAVRKKIGDQYKTTGKKLDMPVKTVKHLFKLEKFRRENEAAEKEFDGRDRDGFMQAAQMFGEDSPFGQFALAAAGRAKKDGFGGGGKAGSDGGGTEPGED
jgi:hypothetical protein